MNVGAWASRSPLTRLETSWQRDRVTELRREKTLPARLRLALAGGG